MASYLWVARDIEIPAVAALLLVADLLATRLVESRPATPRSDDVAVYSLAGLLFAFIFLLRIGVQTSLDFGGMDWRAAAFDDVQTPLWTIVSGIAWKHISVMVLLAATLLAPFGRRFAARVVAALLGAFALRSVTLVLMLLLCRTSYWTMLRVISDLPHALMGLLVAAAAWLVTTCWSDRRGMVPV
jgi:hypothetical protein